MNTLNGKTPEENLIHALWEEASDDEARPEDQAPPRGRTRETGTTNHMQHLHPTEQIFATIFALLVFACLAGAIVGGRKR